MKEFKINLDQLQELVNYLAKQPYVDVFKLMEICQNLPKIENEKDIKDAK